MYLMLMCITNKKAKSYETIAKGFSIGLISSQSRKDFPVKPH